MPCRFTAQSKAESPPPTSSTSLPRELLGVDHLEVEPVLLEPVLPFDAQLPGLEGADPGADDDGPAGIFAIAVSSTKWTIHSVVDPPEPGHDLAQVGRRAELERLLHHPRDQVLGEHLGKAGDVEDVLLGVERLSWPPSAGNASMILADAPACRRRRRRRVRSGRRR